MHRHAMREDMEGRGLGAALGSGVLPPHISK